MVLAIVPAAPPTRKNRRATSWPAPISAKVPYLVTSRLIWRAFSSVPISISGSIQFLLRRFLIAANSRRWVSVGVCVSQCLASEVLLIRAGGIAQQSEYLVHQALKARSRLAVGSG